MSLSFLTFFLIKDFPSAGITAGMGPRLMPGLYSAVLAVLSLLLIVIGIFKIRKNTDIEKEKITFKQIEMPLFLVVIILIYLILLKRIGFLITTPLIIFIVMKIMAAKNKISFIIAFSMTVVIYLIFAIGLNVPLPQWKL